TKWHLITRMIPFVENNYNVCELGPRGTGKSHVYKECSPNSLLVSGGQTTVANLFYNMASRQIGLVGMWDVVAFDEVAGITFKDKDGVQIMKDYMASGSFSRGRDSIEGKASMVFVGNINQSVETLVKTSHLLAPFPAAMIDTAFFDRFHAYIPGWEIPKMRPEFFTNRYGLITDYLAEYMREMRKRSFSDAIDKFYKLGNNLNQRDVIAVRRTVSGLLKLLHPNGSYSKEDVRVCLTYAMEARRRVKEQLKKLGGLEFFDVNFSYIDNETLEEF
ncbi:BREX system Lon protease-like protein BrxL, partial [Salmonella enterica subsp. enterica serovar Albany]|nr:BREX system Lon protease-like protein BrxL [Salmonella enterica subsp. enterica serovar Albany]